MFDFNWQVGYDFAKPIPLPKGTRQSGHRALRQFGQQQVQSRSGARTIWWGDQNWDEMQSGFLGLVFDAKTDANKVFIPSGPSLLPRGTSAGPTLAAIQAGEKK